MTELNGVVPAIASALNKRGYETLTPVQKSMLDPKLSGRDVLVSAQTGSGKTVAFGLAMAPTLLDGGERFRAAGAPLALAIAPTRELALQVCRELEWLYEQTGAVIASCVGGMDPRNERRALERGAHIIVGTPGRLCDHIRRRSLDISALKAVVLDEADEMLDLGFREDLEFILDTAPAERRTLMFSATVPSAIEKLAGRYQKSSIRITTEAERSQHIDIDYRALLVAPSDRENAIVNVLRFYEARNALVFCSTRAAVNHLTARLHNRNFDVVALSGELTQNERSHALQAMRDGRARVCIATDVAARGIDLPGLELVVHADLPTNPDTLLHRSGRTGRAGRKGVSTLIIPVNARRKAERLLGGAGIEAEWTRPPSADEVTRRDEERLLADPIFDSPVGELEKPLAERLIATHGAEKLVAAFINLYRARQSAPEELLDVALQDSRARKPREPGERSRDVPADSGPRGEFGPSVWFSLSVGRRQNAEPRWIIPMLCRNGGLTKREIGAIKMQQDETFIEIAADSAEALASAAGPNATLERGMRLKRLQGLPDFGKQRAEKPTSFEPREKRRDEKPAGARPAWQPRDDDRQKKRFGGSKSETGAENRSGGKPKSFAGKKKKG